jgi:hypothetical protein
VQNEKGAEFPESFLLESALPSIATVEIIYVGRSATLRFWLGDTLHTMIVSLKTAVEEGVASAQTEHSEHSDLGLLW